MNIINNLFVCTKITAERQDSFKYDFVYEKSRELCLCIGKIEPNWNCELSNWKEKLLRIWVDEGTEGNQFQQTQIQLSPFSLTLSHSRIFQYHT